MLFTAAYVDNASVSSSMIDQIWSHASSNTTNFGIFPTVYTLSGSNAGTSGNSAQGKYGHHALTVIISHVKTFFPSPAIGGVFAPLALK